MTTAKATLLTQNEHDDVLQMARLAKRQPWRTSNIWLGEMRIHWIVPTEEANATDSYGSPELTPAGEEALGLYKKHLADPNIPRLEEVNCDYCGKLLPPNRDNACQVCRPDELEATDGAGDAAYDRWVAKQ